MIGDKEKIKSVFKQVALPALAMVVLCMGALFAAKQQGNEKISSDTQEPQTTLLEETLKGGEEEVMVDSLVLVDETIPQVLGLLEKLTGRILIMPSNLPSGKINLNIPVPLTKKEAITGLKSVLNANGVAVTPLGEKYMRAVPLNRAKSSAPELLEQDELRSTAASQEICSHIFPLSNLTAREAARMVYSSLTPGVSSVVTLDKANALLITDSLSNLQRLDTIFAKIDKVGDVKEELLFFDLKNVSAKDLKNKLQVLQKGVLKRYLYGNTSFEDDGRTNQLIVMTPAGNLSLIRRFIDRLDVNVSPLTKSHVFRIKHGSGKELTELIKKLVQQQKDQEKAKAEAQGLAAPASITEEGAASSIKPIARLEHETFAQFSNQLSVECDDRSNAVVVYGTPTDIRQIGELIDQLDVILPQVRIEVIIAEVRLTKGQVSGLESFGYNFGGKTSTFQNATGFKGPTDTSPFNITKLTLNKFTFDGVFNTAKTNDNVSILSSPTLLTTHNREAIIKVAETRPYVSSIQTKVAEGSKDPTIANSTVEKMDAGIELKVKPLIGLNGIVQLEVDQTVDNFISNSQTNLGSTISMPHVTRRNAKSFVTVQSGEVLILAGLKQKEFEDQNRKMFFLGSLPVVGDALFTSKGKKEVLKELIIFLRPYVLTDVEIAQKDTQALTKQLNDVTQKDVQYYLDNGQFRSTEINNPSQKSKATKKAPAISNKKRLKKVHPPRMQRSKRRAGGKSNRIPVSA